MKRRLAILTGLLLIFAAVPAATAFHLSAGTESRVLVNHDSGAIRQSSNEPTVPDDGPDSPYQVGTSTDCFETDGNVSNASEDAPAVATEDTFCGQLRYHTDIPNLEHVSPPDQHVPGEEKGLVTGELTFDVVYVNHLGFRELEKRCEPFCLPNPAGDASYDTLHEVGSQAGVTDSPEEANERQSNDRTQQHSATVMYPSAGRIAQWNTEAWEMNGPTPLSGTNSYVAFLEDEAGPISKERLQAIVDSNDEFASGTLPTICGMTPDADFTSNVNRASCEIAFEYVADEGQSGGGVDEGVYFGGDDEGEYNDKCNSPAFICNAANGPSWYATDEGILFESFNGQYAQWHWFVAPHGSACTGAQEPGMSFNSDDGTIPYLAHDLDVYTDPGQLAGTPETGSPRALAGQGLFYEQGYVGDVLDDVIERSGVNDIIPPLGQVDTALPSEVNRNPQVEPNAQSVGSLEDTSQSIDDPDLERSAGDKCTRLTGGETEETADPWTDIVDSRVLQGPASWPDTRFAFNNDLNGEDGIGLYPSGEDADSSNNRGPGYFFTRGKIGMFADKNDDGDYDQVNFGSKYDVSAITETGAYPLLWNMYVDDQGAIDTDSGCVRTTGQGVSFPQIMKNQGYGPNTGLFQAIYLQEPAVFDWAEQGQSVAYTSGDNIYLLMSQAAKHFWEGPDAIDPDGLGDSPLDNKIDLTIQQLRSTVASSETQIQLPGDDLGATNDYHCQLAEDTGGFESKFSFTHQCETDCSGDTVVTGYVFETLKPALGSDDQGATLPPLVVGDDTWEIGTGSHTWLDVDPFDGDAARNTGDCSRPAHTSSSRCNAVAE